MLLDCGLTCIVCTSKKIRRHYRYRDMDIYRCGECGMLFQDPRRFRRYNQKMNQMYLEDFDGLEIRKKLACDAINRIEHYCGTSIAGLRVLEIGLGSGALASESVVNNAFYQGIEPSEFFYNKILGNFPELKGKIQNCLLDEAHLDSKSFDIAILIDTLEHIPYPIDFLRRISGYLKDKGALYVEIPNESLFRFKGMLRRILGLYSGYPTHPGHVNIFTPHTLRKTFVLSGMNPTLSQITIIGDHKRMRLIFNNKLSDLLWPVSNFFRLTKLDILLQQGNIAAFATKAN